MSETSEAKMDYLKGNITKVLKWVLLCSNCFFMLPQLFANRSLINAGVFLAIYLVLFLILNKSPEETPACAYIPLTVLADLFLWGCLHFLSIRDFFDIAGFVEYLANIIAQPICKVLLVSSAATAIIGLCNVKLTWFTGISGLLLSSAFMLNLWGEGVLGSAFFSVLVIGFGVWSFLLQFITAAVPAKRKNCVLIGTILLLALIVLIGGTQSSDFMLQARWEAFARELPYAALSWWRVVIAAVLLVASSVFLYDLGGNVPSSDCLIAAVAAILLLTVRLTYSIYFTWNCTLLLLLMISLYLCAVAAMRGHSLFAFSNGIWMGVQFPLFWLALLLLRDGLWINIVVTVLFTVYFYRQAFHKTSKNMGNFFWFMILLCIGAETVGWMLRRNYSLEGFILIGTIILMAFIVSQLLGKSHPAGLQSPASLRILLCAAAEVLCFLTMIQHGAKIRADYDNDVQLITVQMNAKGKENAIGDISYFWKDKYGQQSSEERFVSQAQFQIAPMDEQLVVVVQDANGVQTTRCFWFSAWERTK